MAINIDGTFLPPPHADLTVRFLSQSSKEAVILEHNLTNQIHTSAYKLSTSIISTIHVYKIKFFMTIKIYQYIMIVSKDFQFFSCKLNLYLCQITEESRFNLFTDGS